MAVFGTKKACPRCYNTRSVKKHCKSKECQWGVCVLCVKSPYRSLVYDPKGRYFEHGGV